MRCKFDAGDHGAWGFYDVSLIYYFWQVVDPRVRDVFWIGG